MVQPPTKRINISTRQSGLWDCKQKNKETVSAIRTVRETGLFAIEEIGLFAVLRDRQKRPDSLLYSETVRRDRTLCCTQTEKRSDSLLYSRPSEEIGLFAVLRDRQKRSDSLLYSETVRRDRTLCCTQRPSEEIGLFAVLRDRQKRPDSIRSSRTVVVARQPLASRDQKFCSTMFVERPLYTHWRCPQCNARDGSQASYIPSTNQDCLEFRRS